LYHSHHKYEVFVMTTTNETPNFTFTFSEMRKIVRDGREMRVYLAKKGDEAELQNRIIQTVVVDLENRMSQAKNVETKRILFKQICVMSSAQKRILNVLRNRLGIY